MKFGTIATFLLVASLFTFLVPTAAADGCAAEASATAIGPLYLGADLTLWQESNNLAGLQRSACDDDNGRSHPRDTPVL